MKEFDKIIGYKSTKKEFEKLADILKNTEKYKKSGIMLPKGILIKGKSGVGKTLFADCLAEASGRKVFSFKHEASCKHFSEKLTNIFKSAKEHTPSVILLDDLDKYIEDDIDLPDYSEYTVVQNLIDEISESDVFVIATVYLDSYIPEAFIRSGRFDCQITLEPTYGEETEKLVKIFLENKNVGEVDIENVTHILSGKPFATIRSVINEAAILAENDKQKISTDYIVYATLSMIYNINNLTPKSKTQNNASRKVAIHEAGHAVVSEILRENSVSLISVYNTYYNKGGIIITEQDPKNDFDTNQNGLAIALGGIAAGELYFGEKLLMKHDDILTAFEYGKNIVVGNCKNGFECYRQDKFYVDSEVEKVINIEIGKYYDKVKSLLFLNKEFLDKTAEELTKCGHLCEKDIKQIKNKCKIIKTEI